MLNHLLTYEKASLGIVCGVAGMNPDSVESGYVYQEREDTLEPGGPGKENLVLTRRNSCFALDLLGPYLVLQGGAFPYAIYVEITCCRVFFVSGPVQDELHLIEPTAKANMTTTAKAPATRYIR